MTTSSPSTTSSLTAANLTFFDALAAKYDITPWQKRMSLLITTFVRQNLSFISIPTHSSPTTLLDYACGTGMISHALGPSVTTIKALDLLPKMIARYNECAAASDIPSVRNARAIEGNLLTDPPPCEELAGPEWHDFDIAAVGGGLHHFEDPGLAIMRLAQRVRSGGVVVIVDFVEDDEVAWVSTNADHTIHKRGFREWEIREMMEGSGLGAFGWKEMPELLEMVFHDGKTVKTRGFLARAAKA